PAGLLQQLVRLFDAELPLRILRYETLWVVDEIPRRNAGAPVDMLLYRCAIDEQFHRLSDGRVAEQWVLRLDARAFAVNLGPGIRTIELNMLDVAAGHDLGAAPGIAASFQFEKDLVLDLQVPRIVVFAGLNDGACGRHGVAAALHLDRVEIW